MYKIEDGISSGIQGSESLYRAPELRPTMSPDQAWEYLNRAGNVQWIPANQLYKNAYDACIDGRTREPVIGNPGGDMAIATEAVIAVANQLRKPTDQTELHRVMGWFLDEFGEFYLHTDEHGLHALERNLNTDPALVSALGGELQSLTQIEHLIKQPPAELQVKLLSHLLNPENIGCGHIKQMLNDPKAYAVSRKVITGLMTAYFDLMWNGSEKQKQLLNYPILTGEHNEKAVVVITFPNGVEETTLIPMVRPNDGKDSVFVVHPQVTHFMQEQVARRLVQSGIFPKMGPSMVNAMLSHMKTMHTKETQTTASRLAWGLPIIQFEVRK